MDAIESSWDVFIFLHRGYRDRRKRVLGHVDARRAARHDAIAASQRSIVTHSAADRYVECRRAYHHGHFHLAFEAQALRNGKD
jgi:hypothetical protein